MIGSRALEFAKVVPEPIILVSGDGTVLDLNPAAARMLNCRRQQICGSSLMDYSVSPSETVRNYLGFCAASSEPLPGTLAFPDTEGSPVDYRCHGAAIRLGEQKITLGVVIRCISKESAISKFVTLNQQILELIAVGDSLSPKTTMHRSRSFNPDSAGFREKSPQSQ